MPPETTLACAECGSPNTRLATDAVYVVYLRCDSCFNVWSMPKEQYLKQVKQQKEDGDDR